MIPFNYHHLYYFYVIAEEGSVTRAARRLRLAQSSLSMQLAQFETFLEKKLFMREGRKLLLTEEGRHILGYAKAIFDLGDELSDSLGDRLGSGRLRIQIGVSSLIPKAFVDTLLKFLFEQQPAPVLTLVEENLENMISDLGVHKIDMVLNDVPYRVSAEEGIQNHLLASIPVVLCSSKTMARRIKSLPRDLNTIPIILPTAQSRTYHALQEYFLSHKIRPNVIAEIQDVELVRRLVLAGRAIAPLNEITVLKAPAREKLTIVGRRDMLGIRDTIYLIRKARRLPHPLVTRLIESFGS